MRRYFSERSKSTQDGPSENGVETPHVGSFATVQIEGVDVVDFDISQIVSDPGLRKQIVEYDVNLRDQVRREYIAKGPCQPRNHVFPKRQYGNDRRSFRPCWYDDFDWLEYSEHKDVAFCFICYLFKSANPGQYVDDTFTKSGFTNWKNATKKFQEHVGAAGSVHNNARISFDGFRNQRQSVTRKISYGGVEMERAYKMRCIAIFKVIRFLLKQGLPFRGHDESATSLNKGNFLELLDFLSGENEEVRKVIKENAPGNNKMISPSIQKQMVHACAMVTLDVILKEIGQKRFTLLVDESHDVSVKEQMGVVLRYVNDFGAVIERFLSVVRVKDTSAACLKVAIDDLFSTHKLSLSNLRGQGYDGASNMRGEFNGLKTLILKENPSARYVHCFAHRLQLVVVAVSKSIQKVSDFFSYVGLIVNMTASSCKRMDSLRQKEHDRVLSLLESGEVTSGKGQHQATSLARPGDTRWGSHYITLFRLQSMWPYVVGVLDNVLMDGLTDQRGMAESLLEKMEHYTFVFVMHLMIRVLEITNILSRALQDKNQNMVQAFSMIETTKAQLQRFREMGWESLLQAVNTFCMTNSIDIVNMDDTIRSRSRRLRDGEAVTYYQIYRVEIFCPVLDSLITEMNNRFPETSMEILLSMACLDPSNSFARFNIAKLVRLAEFYPEDFSLIDLSQLPTELEAYYLNMKADTNFGDIQNLQVLSMRMVEHGKARAFPLVYRLIELALLLPVATASVERAFSAMKIVKSDLRNKMSDEWMCDSLIVYIEKEIFLGVDQETVLQTFQNLRTRKYDMPSDV